MSQERKTAGGGVIRDGVLTPNKPKPEPGK